ncbi:MAG: glycosyltransferase [Desulfatibacillum sp.]|nr:glycosyltransferase [Desulfatibacillum sp.]
MPEPMRILHLITTTDTGGAEAMLAKLCQAMDRDRFSSRVVSMVHAGPVAREIAATGIQVESLGLDLGKPMPGSVWRLIKIIREFKPQVVQTWLYHADLMGLIAARMCSHARVAWNIRNSNIDFSQYRKLTGWTVKACARFSSFPDAVIANSHVGRDFHMELGYAPKRFEVIPNGFDLDRFSRDELQGRRIREELGIDPAAPVVTMIARQDPMKDHDTLMRAIALVCRVIPDARLILCGDRVDPDNATLYGLVRDLGIEANVLLLGRRRDMPEILSATDVSVLSSLGEGFPNVVGEAMACQAPVVANNVGDVARIMGDTGVLVPGKDAVAMAGALMELLTMDKEKKRLLGIEARQRIVDMYSMESVVSQYEDFYGSLIA